MTSDPALILKAAAILKSGGLVALPTETVYGLGADASNPAALRRLFAVKGRPMDHPVIVHLASAEQMQEWAIDIPQVAWTLARRFWPGPLTLIVRRAAHVHDAVTGGQDTVGLRVPSHPVAQELLRAFGGGIAAPSANRFGRISPTTAQHVRDELGDAIDLVLDGGPCEVGIESTIVDCSTTHPRVLRPGRITSKLVAKALGVAIVGHSGSAAPRVSGSLDAHYAPCTPMRVVAPNELVSAVEAAAGMRVVVYSRGLPQVAIARHWPAPAIAIGYARDLYAALREMDAAGADLILVEQPPQAVEWAGINDRLRRAVFGSGH